MIEKFWLEKANTYSEEGFEINEVGTHPQLIKSFEKHCPNAEKVLDFGCGDGSLILKLKNKIEVSLYDISEPMLSIAEKKLKHLSPILYKKDEDIPENYFDCIFISMVIVCVSEEAEVDAIIDRVVQTKNEKGTVLVANPHPCFRDKPFSSYYTEYTIGKPFSYFNNGERHKIMLRNENMKFYDYNWSISFLLNSFLKRGLRLQEIVEIEDNRTNEFYNKNFSPSIIYIFK